MNTPKLSTITIKELALIVGRKLEEHHIDAVLVGGACVSIYARNKYVSGDLDLISHEGSRKIGAALAELGFSLERNKYYVHPHCPFFLEFLAPPVAIGAEPVTTFSRISSRIGEIKLLTPTDCVKDRLSAWYHWNDRQSLEQALLVARARRVDLKEIARWSLDEGQGAKFALFKEKMKGEKK